MRILVFGSGLLAHSVIQGLTEVATEISVLGDDRSDLERLCALPKVTGLLMAEPVMFDYLTEAGIAQTDLFLALSPDDHENLLVSQIAYQMYNVPRVICNVLSPGLITVATMSSPGTRSNEDFLTLSYAVGFVQEILHNREGP